VELSTWRNPWTHIPKMIRRVKEGCAAGGYLVFLLISVVCFVGAVLFLIRAF
jgi:hypothetical protein